MISDRALRFRALAKLLVLSSLTRDFVTSLFSTRIARYSPNENLTQHLK